MLNWTVAVEYKQKKSAVVWLASREHGLEQMRADIEAENEGISVTTKVC